MQAKDERSRERNCAIEPIPFTPAQESSENDAHPFSLTSLPESAGQVFEAIDQMSRRIDDLARELNCLGFFDNDDDDSPRAA